MGPGMHVLQRFGAAFAGSPRSNMFPTCPVEGLHSGCWVAGTNVVRKKFRGTGRSPAADPLDCMWISANRRMATAVGSWAATATNKELGAIEPLIYLPVGNMHLRHWAVRCAGRWAGTDPARKSDLETFAILHDCQSKNRQRLSIDVNAKPQTTAHHCCGYRSTNTAVWFRSAGPQCAHSKCAVAQHRGRACIYCSVLAPPLPAARDETCPLPAQ